MALFRKFFRLQNDDAGGTGGGAAVDRGDTLEPLATEVVVDPAVAAADAAAAALEADLAAKKPEGEGDADADPDKPKPKDTRIPLSRHEAVLNKAREENAELKRQLAQRQTAQATTDVNAEITTLETSVAKLEKEYATLLTDGEIDKATAVMAQIRQAERQMAESRSNMRIDAAVSGATERARFNTALERIESSYPTLNPDHESYDAELDGNVAQLKGAYEKMGYTPTLALQAAVKALAGAQTVKQEAATTVKPNVAEKDVAAERKKDAVGKTVAAVAKTPASLTKVGQDSDKLGGGSFDAKSVMAMSQKQFATLNDETLAQMRGDTI